MAAPRHTVRFRSDQEGYTLIEIMIALLIGIFLMGALLTIVQTNKTVFQNQSQLALLHDSERMAMTLMADVIQSAGYFPDPTANTIAVLIPAAPFASGQPISGTYSAADPGDSISVRYMTQGGDGILNCSGQSNPVGGPNQIYVNVFKVINGQLTCTMNATQYNLVSGATNPSSAGLGITHMKILYGVNTAGSGNNVDTYLRADQMTAANWANVISVQITLTFTNPMYIPNQGQPTTVALMRVVGVMNQVGPML
jgi:type IV pilus assembly protein PilW